MLVYMLVNVITEKAYVGQTQKSLAERWRDHKKQAMGGSTAPLHVAMREWNKVAWRHHITVASRATSIHPISPDETNDSA